MHYQPRDRSPILDIGYWPEKLVVWHDQSLPEDISEEGGRYLHDFFGADFPIRRGPSLTGVLEGLGPHFPERALEDRGACEVFQQGDGVRVLRKKLMGSSVAPDVPLRNHQFYLETVRRVWGQDIDLKPVGWQEG